MDILQSVEELFFVASGRRETIDGIVARAINTRLRELLVRSSNKYPMQSHVLADDIDEAPFDLETIYMY